MKTLQTSKIIQTPEGSEDCVWTANGTLLMAHGAKLFKYTPEIDKNWQEIADLESLGIKQITRLAVNPANSLLAFVAL